MSKIELILALLVLGLGFVGLAYAYQVLNYPLPDQRVDGYLKQAAEAEKRKELPRAKRLYNVALTEAEKSRSDVLVERVETAALKLYLAQENLPEAEALLRRTMDRFLSSYTDTTGTMLVIQDRKERTFNTMSALSKVLLAENKKSEAEQLLNQTKKLTEAEGISCQNIVEEAEHPDNLADWSCRFNTGKRAFRSGKVREAHHIFTRCLPAAKSLAKHSDNSPLEQTLSWLYRCEIQFGQIDHARAGLEQALKLYEHDRRKEADWTVENASARCLLATCYSKQNLPAESKRLREEALALNIELLNRLQARYSPAEVARTAVSLAESYRVVNEWDLIKQMYIEAASLFEKAEGPYGLDIAAMKSQTAECCRVLNQLDEDEKYLNQAREIYAHHGRSTTAYADAAFALASLYMGVGKLTQSESLYQESLSIFDSEHSPEAFRVMQQLADVYMNTNRADKAISLYKRALAYYQNAEGAYGPTVGHLFHSLANAYAACGDIKATLASYQQALTVYDRRDGPNNAASALIVRCLAQALMNNGQPAQALLLYKRELSRCASTNAKAPEFASTLCNLASVYQLLSEPQRVKESLQRVVALRDSDQLSRTDKGAVSELLAVFYMDHGQPSKALPLLQEKLEIDEISTGKASMDVALDLNRMAIAHTLLQQHTQAQALYPRIIAIREPKCGAWSAVVAATYHQFANSCMNSGDYAKSESLFQHAIECTRRSAGLQSEEGASLQLGLGSLYQKMHRLALAKRMYQEALKTFAAAEGEGTIGCASAFRALGDNCRSMHDYERAEEFYRKNLEILQRKNVRIKWLLNTVKLICETYDESGHPERKQKLYAELIASYSRTAGPQSHQVLALQKAFSPESLQKDSATVRR